MCEKHPDSERERAYAREGGREGERQRDRETERQRDRETNSSVCIAVPLTFTQLRQNKQLMIMTGFI